MMEENKVQEDIIAIRNRGDVEKANKAFDDFMLKTENCFNERSRKEPKLYAKCGPLELEKITEALLKEVCPSTPFLPEDIKLVSGHKFPDIITTDFYGVEVKSTEKDKWTSTGSSIVESTRIPSIERIYMLFGNLGSKPPMFRCKPYQECLSDIGVTHSPRYRIDMSLDKSENIFSKIDVPYDNFRILEENTKISLVRTYYREKAKKENRTEMPWWMIGDARPCISIFSDQKKEFKQFITIRAFILFPNVFSNNSSQSYKQIALWLCNRYSLICHNMRDFFTAGGRIEALNGQKALNGYPKIVGNLFKYRAEIKALLYHPDEEILEDIEDNWDNDFNKDNLYLSWISMIEKCFKQNDELKKLDIKNLLTEKYFF